MSSARNSASPTLAACQREIDAETKSSWLGQPLSRESRLGQPLGRGSGLGQFVVFIFRAVGSSTAHSRDERHERLIGQRPDGRMGAARLRALLLKEEARRGPAGPRAGSTGSAGLAARRKNVHKPDVHHLNLHKAPSLVGKSS
eukprot:SAG22_NODE_3570_length_1636_cov_3.327912_2_plen_143_part_00